MQPKNQYSDIKIYANQIEEPANLESGQALLRKIAPLPNARGVLVVEVDKACRDLQMLTRTIKVSKFYKVIVGSEIVTDEEDENEKDE